MLVILIIVAWVVFLDRYFSSMSDEEKRALPVPCEIRSTNCFPSFAG